MCALGLLLCSFITGGLVIYFLALPHMHIIMPQLMLPVVTSGLLIMITQSVFALRFTGHLRKGTIFTERERRQSFLVHIICIILSALLCLNIITNISNFMRNRAGLALMSDLSVILTTLFAVYLCIMRDTMISTIKRQHEDIIASIGQHTK